jgi:hypothetical protein
MDLRQTIAGTAMVFLSLTPACGTASRPKKSSALPLSPATSDNALPDTSAASSPNSQAPTNPTTPASPIPGHPESAPASEASASLVGSCLVTATDTHYTGGAGCKEYHIVLDDKDYLEGQKKACAPTGANSPFKYAWTDGPCKTEEAVGGCKISFPLKSAMGDYSIEWHLRADTSVTWARQLKSTCALAGSIWIIPPRSTPVLSALSTVNPGIPNIDQLTSLALGADIQFSGPMQSATGLISPLSFAYSQSYKIKAASHFTFMWSGDDTATTCLDNKSHKNAFGMTLTDGKGRIFQAAGDAVIGGFGTGSFGGDLPDGDYVLTIIFAGAENCSIEGKFKFSL